MKEDPSFDAIEKQKESEFWHANSLEIACSFLPGECPLLNHINSHILIKNQVESDPGKKNTSRSFKYCWVNSS